DMSIPMVTPERGYDLAKETVARGISSIKIKVGGDLRDDVARVEAVREGAPNVGLILDANQATPPMGGRTALGPSVNPVLRPILWLAWAISASSAWRRRCWWLKIHLRVGMSRVEGCTMYPG